MLRRFCLILSLAIGMVLLAVLPALAESVDTAWVRRYNGPGNYTDEAYATAVDDSGNVYVTGYSEGSGTWIDYATIKYCPNGDTAWVRRYDGPPGNRPDFGRAIAVDRSGNVYVTGYSEGSGTSSGSWTDYATIKYFPNGDTAWVRRYDGPGNGWDGARAIAVDDSSNVYVTGGSVGSAIYAECTTIKYYTNGDTAWVRRYKGTGNSPDCGNAIAVDSCGNVYVTGSSHCVGAYDDYVTIKYFANGDTAWVRTYNGPGDSTDVTTAIALDDSGNVYVTGYSWGGWTTWEDFATIKYYPDGDTAWVRRHNGGGSLDDKATAIAVGDSGNVYVTGYCFTWTKGQDCVTIKYSPNGSIIWVTGYNGPENFNDGALAIAVDRSYNVYVAGYSGGMENKNYLTIKYYLNGDTAWVRRHNGQGNYYDKAYAIAVDSSGNIYVTGVSYSGIETGFDYATIKYVQTNSDVNDEAGNREKPSEFTLFQNYPNPFNQATKIEFTLAKPGFVNLNVYDILGRKVRTLVSEHLSSGYKSVLWEGKNNSGEDVASGIYFYQLKVEDSTSGGVGDFTLTKKLLLLK